MGNPTAATVNRLPQRCIVTHTSPVRGHDGGATDLDCVAAVVQVKEMIHGWPARFRISLRIDRSRWLTCRWDDRLPMPPDRQYDDAFAEDLGEAMEIYHALIAHVDTDQAWHLPTDGWVKPVRPAKEVA